MSVFPGGESMEPTPQRVCLIDSQVIRASVPPPVQWGPYREPQRVSQVDSTPAASARCVAPVSCPQSAWLAVGCSELQMDLALGHGTVNITEWSL